MHIVLALWKRSKNWSALLSQCGLFVLENLNNKASVQGEVNPMRYKYLILLIPLMACSLTSPSNTAVENIVQATIVAENYQMRAVNATLQAENSALKSRVQQMPQGLIPNTGDAPVQPNMYSAKPDGYYLVNSEIAVGTWRTDSGYVNCTWAITSEKGDILESYFGISGGVIIIKPEAYQLGIQNCGLLKFLQ
jgi:hypothetical protein